MSLIESDEVAEYREKLAQARRNAQQVPHIFDSAIKQPKGRIKHMENQAQQPIDTAILEFYKTVDQLDQHQLEDLAKQYGARLSEANRHWRDYEANAFLLSIVSARVSELGNSESK